MATCTGSTLTPFPTLTNPQKAGSSFSLPAIHKPPRGTTGRPSLAVTNSSLEDRSSKVTSSSGGESFRWAELGRNRRLTEAQKKAISELPYGMSKRCKALMRQLICFSPDNGTHRLSHVLDAWVRIMKPRRCDWLSVLKQLRSTHHPLYIKVAELALLQESFEANVRDYTKVIHYYGKQNQCQEAESAFIAMKTRGFVCDQVTFTTLINMYSKVGNLRMAEETFDELKLLDEPLDKRSYGSIIMAYIRAGMLGKGEALISEMDDQEICAGSEVYKALLRAYSMVGDCEGAQRVFDSIQFAGIPPDARMCGLLINAYQMAGQSEKARIAFENMRRAGLEPTDKCIAVVVGGYEKENKLNEALDFLMGLERRGVVIGKEASEVLARWFGRLGVVKEVEGALREYAMGEAV